MDKKVDFLSEDELKNLDTNILEDYLVTLESIEQGLDEYIEDKKNEEKGVNDNDK